MKKTFRNAVAVGLSMAMLVSVAPASAFASSEAAFLGGIILGTALSQPGYVEPAPAYVVPQPVYQAPRICYQKQKICDVYTGCVWRQVQYYC